MARTSSDAQLSKIRSQIEALKAKEKALLSKANTKVIAQIISLAKRHNVTIEELTEALAKSKPSSKAKAPKVAKKAAGREGVKVAPKYRNPNDASQTWTGRGKSPAWCQALKDAGTFDSALITTE
jgi:DNA-binding protein H-NS